MRGARWPGDNKVDCQRCGFTFPSSKIQQEWTGLYVCSSCWEPRHPQTLIKIREETAKPSFVNRDSIETFTGQCDIAGSSGYAGLAKAGCAQAGNETIPYSLIDDLFSNGHGDI